MLKPLTSLRFFAALLVFFTHCPLTMYVADRFGAGNAGVEFFFVLSGFILVYAHRELFSRLDWHQVKEFWVARFARIYPVHVLAFAFAMLIVYRSHGFGWIADNVDSNLHALLTQVTLTQSWIYIESLFNFNGVAWSVSDEVFFYATFPVMAAALSAIVRRGAWSSAIAAAAALWLIAVVIAIHKPGEFVLYNFPPTRLVDFGIGCCFGAVFGARGLSRKTVAYSLATAIEVVALGGALFAIAATPFVPEPFRYSVWLAPYSALVIYVFALGRGAVSQALGRSATVYLGEISYNFYMLHALILVVVFGHLGTRVPLAVTLLSLILCLCVSVIVYERYEHPLRATIRSAFGSYSAVTPSGTVSAKGTLAFRPTSRGSKSADAHFISGQATSGALRRESESRPVTPS